jgi:autotransporter-associated beta strand protein
VQTVSPSIYTLTLTNITSTSPKQIGVVVGGNPSLLLWNNASGDNEWDVEASFNWSNLVSHVAEQFANADTVSFDDSITNAATPGTNIDIGYGQVVIPAVITNNSTVSYTLSGQGKISGGARIVKMGSGTLTISNMNNDFSGDITILGGTLKSGWSAGELGATNGAITITNGATLDRGWSMVKPIVVSGAGVDGNGAIVNNSGGNAIYDGGAGGLTPSLTLAGDTTIGGNTRMDLGGNNGASLNCLNGSNYNLTIKLGSSYDEWQRLTIDTNLGNIDLYAAGGSLGIKGSGASLGNPSDTMTVHTNAGLTFWGDSVNNSGYAKNIHVLAQAYVAFRPQNADAYYDSALSLDEGAEFDFFNGGGNGTVLLGPVTLNGLVHIQIGDSTVIISNVISGPGGFYLDNYNNTLVFTATNTYQGITDIRSGRTLSLAGNGLISQSTPISLASGATLVATNRADRTFTLANGQTLEGGGTVTADNVMVTSGATVLPGGAGSVGTLTVSSNVVFQAGGDCDVLLNKGASPSNSVLASTSGTILFGGTLMLTNIGSALAAGDSFKLFNASAYNGTFSAISPATPGPNLAWNTNSLTTDGTISVVSAAAPVPVVTGIGLSGATLTITATNGSKSGMYVLLQSTNVALPLAQWTPVLTNNFDGSGDLNLSTNIVNPGDLQEFYILLAQ